MDHTIGRLARPAGISTRTLRLYDQMGLLKPVRDPENAYRLYGAEQVDRLQQIFVYSLSLRLSSNKGDRPYPPEGCFEKDPSCIGVRLPW